MKSNKKLSLIFSLLLIFFSVIYYGCGTDDVTTTPVGPPPSIRMTPGSTYDFTYDSLTATTAVIRLGRTSHDVVQPSVVFTGKTCFPIYSTTKDSTGATISVDTNYYSYDSTAGKFYQYGISKFINPASGNPTWDLVADFSVSMGTTWNIGTVNYVVNIGGTPYTFTGPLTAKVAEQTTIQTTGVPSQSINCYRIELYTHLNSNPPGVTADIYVDYYLGYSSSSTNPAGLVELKLRPFNFMTSGTVLVSEPGDDRRLRNFTIAP